MKTTLVTILLAVCVFSVHASESDFWIAHPERVPWLGKTQVVASNLPSTLADENFVTCYVWGGWQFEAEGLRWPTPDLALALETGRPLIIGTSPITAAEASFQRRPELVETACRNIDDEKLILEWYPKGSVSPFYWCCTNNPVWQDFLIERNCAAIDIGVDGLLLDEIYGTSHAIWNGGGCFCEYCMAGFRDHLKEHYSDGELRTGFGIAEIDTFDYGDYIRSGGYAATWRSGRLNSVPMFSDFQEFQQNAVFRAMQRVLGESRRYAEGQFGRYVPFCANINDLNTSGLKFSAMLDWFMCETFYRDLGYPPSAKALPVAQLARGLGREAWFLPATTTNADLLTWPSTDQLMRLLLADAYSGGGAYFLPYEIYAFDDEAGQSTGGFTGDLELIAPYFRFVLDNRFLFEQMRKPAPVALLYPFCSITEGVWSAAHDPFFDLAAALYDAHITYDVLPIGDGTYLANSLLDVDLSTYSCLLIPSATTLPVAELELLRSYCQAGGTVVSFSADVSRSLLQYGSPNVLSLTSPVSGYFNSPSNTKLTRFMQVMPAPLSDTRLVVTSATGDELEHLNLWVTTSETDLAIQIVNYDYSRQNDSVSSKEELRIGIPVSNIPFSLTEASVYVLSPELPTPIPCEAWSVDNGQLTVSVGSIGIWAIVYIVIPEYEETLLNDALASMPVIAPGFSIRSSDVGICEPASSLSPIVVRQDVLDCAWELILSATDYEAILQSPRVSVVPTLSVSECSLLIDDFEGYAPLIGGRYNYDYSRSDATFYCKMRTETDEGGNRYKAFEFCREDIFKFRIDQIPAYDASSFEGIEITVWADTPMTLDWEMALHSTTQPWTGVWLPDMSIGTEPARYRLPFEGFDPLPDEEILRHLFGIAAWPDAECGTVYWDNLALYRSGAGHPGAREQTAVVFDEFHNQRNTLSAERAASIYPERPELRQFGELETTLSQYLTLERGLAPLSEAMLQQFDVLIISAPRAAFSLAELQSVESFVCSGGGLLILGDSHLPGEIEALLEVFGVSFDLSTICSSSHIGDAPQKFFVM
ncbi:hypothetical protein ACFLS0_06115, partial [Candidatus Bipolaricaulota bacterium]